MSPACLCSMAWFKCPICMTSEILPPAFELAERAEQFFLGTNGSIWLDCSGRVTLVTFRPCSPSGQTPSGIR